jgi:hypothetical protein
MNIFTLSPSYSPQESARMHCDQHLHKMILESAQMLSTAFHMRGFKSSWIYKPSYPKHPCTLWVSSSNHHILWLCELAEELENIRQELGHPFHSSSDVIKYTKEYIQEDFPMASSHLAETFPFAGPAHLSLNQTLSVPEKYQRYYKYKHAAWLDKGLKMSYKDRPIPSFMQEIIKP